MHDHSKVSELLKQRARVLRLSLAVLRILQVDVMKFHFMRFERDPIMRTRLISTGEFEKSF
jgi:hypothetical protein